MSIRRARPEDADFLVELHKRVQHRTPAFEQFFYQAIKDHILAHGRIDAEEAAWLRRELKELAYDTLLAPAARERGLMRPDYVQNLLDEHCAHRGTSLFFGRNEECGLRCIYHGWKYDPCGKCIEQPERR